MKRLSLQVLVLLLLTPLGVQSQVASGLSGKISDASGAAIANAKVVLTADATGVALSTRTTSTGDYNFVNLIPGAYHLVASSGGFESVARSGILMTTGKTTALDMVLPVGNDQQTVVISADTPILQASGSHIETNISGGTIVGMPLNSRNFVQLATLAPGIELPPGTMLPRINGGRPRTNEYLYDGISALQPEPGQVAFFPMIDGIQEFTVEANNVSAEFGRFNGGVVNVTTRSGSNTLHGSLFEFLRNENINARNYFSTTGQKPEYRRNLYGATLGGPLLRNRLFAFADYQGVQQVIGVTRISTVPTVNERAGIFTGVSKIYNPKTTALSGGKYVRDEFTGDTISIPFDSAAQTLLSRIPQPTNKTATSNNYSRTANDSDHQNQFDIRVDGVYRSNDRAFVRYSYFKDVELPVTPFPDGSGAISGSVIGTGGVSGLSHVVGQQAVFDETHTFGTHPLNDLRVGYTRRSNQIAGTTLDNTASAALGIPNIPTNAAFNNALPLFTITGFQQIGPSASTFSQYQTGVWQLVDTFTWNKASHAIKFGVDMRWYQLNTVAPPNPTGAFAFTTTGTNQQGVTSSGNAFASFLLGQVDTFQIDLQQSKIRPRDFIEEYFLQDDWKVAPRLTLNLGARWTLHHPSTEQTNQGAVFNLATQQLDYLGVDGNSRSARELHYGNVAPRIGLNYRPTPQTVVRAGYGIVFIDQSGITTPFTTPQFPFIQNVQQKTQDSVNAAFSLANGPTISSIAHTADAGLGLSVYTAKRTAGSGYVQQWNLAVQHQLTGKFSVEAAYVGSHIVHVGIPDSNLNQLTKKQLAIGSSLLTKVTNPYYGEIPTWSSIGTATVAQAQLLKPYPRFQNIATYRNNSGTTNYHAGEIKLEGQLIRGMNLLFSYTHSKLIDDASSVFSSTVLSSPNSSSLIAADTFNPRLERDLSSGDMPNVISASMTYDLPAGKGYAFASTGILRTVFGNWTADVIVMSQSGMPVTVTQATNNNSFAGFALQRPNVSGTTSLPAGQRTPAKFINTGAFSTAPQFTLGNASRNPVRGPAYRDLDLALVKYIHATDNTLIEFRSEVFDLANTPAFAQPSGSYGASSFGSITSTITDPRVMQFAVRVSR